MAERTSAEKRLIQTQKQRNGASVITLVITTHRPRFRILLPRKKCGHFPRKSTLIDTRMFEASKSSPEGCAYLIVA